LGRPRRAFPNLPIAADGWLDRLEKDPDEATVISSGEKECWVGLITRGMASHLAC
jgi:hypothetical protein